jgi:HD-GYP domain-containing protein (c-di-GMP phosphodiesterase class II)
MSREEAIAEIKRNAGTQFEPIVADIFLNIIAKENILKRREKRWDLLI